MFPLCFLPAIVIGLRVSNPIVPTKIDDTHVWLRRACRAFRDTFPDAPTGLA